MSGPLTIEHADPASPATNPISTELSEGLSGADRVGLKLNARSVIVILFDAT